MSAEAERRRLNSIARRTRSGSPSTPSSLLWQLGDDVSRRVYEQERLCEDLEEERRAEGAARRTDQAARTALMVAWGITALAVWVAVSRASSWPALPSDLMSGLDILQWCAGATGVAAVVLALANHRFYRAMVRYEWNVEQRVAALRRQTDQFLHAGGAGPDGDALASSARLGPDPR